MYYILWKLDTMSNDSQTRYEYLEECKKNVNKMLLTEVGSDIKNFKFCINFDKTLDNNMTYDTILKRTPIYLIFECISELYKSDFECFKHNLEETGKRYNTLESHFALSKSTLTSYLTSYLLAYIPYHCRVPVVEIALYMHRDFTYSNLIYTIRETCTQPIMRDKTNGNFFDQVLPPSLVTIDEMLKMYEYTIKYKYLIPIYIFDYYFENCNYSSVEISDIDKLEKIYNIVTYRDNYSFGEIPSKPYNIYSTYKSILIDYNKEKENDITTTKVMYIFYKHIYKLLTFYPLESQDCNDLICLIPTSFIDLIPTDLDIYLRSYEYVKVERFIPTCIELYEFIRKIQLRPRAKMAVREYR